ncbi:MAG: Uma2 family endonuclease [Lawsonibacter sp.]|nr:Uma2 family endonuclease [Lawsonibacter sp.]
MALPAEEMRYTFADYLTWDEDDHIELIYGYPYMMSSPSTEHQLVSGELFAQLHTYLADKKCRVIAAPYAVRLFEEASDRPEDVNTVVEPDLVVICDPSKMDRRGCKGTPDLVIEILSPSSRRHDRIVKLDLYQRAGVREYWVVNPEDRTVQVMLLKDSYLLPVEDYGREDMAKVNILEDCAIDLSKVFSE